jgi:hypothetical protein
MVAEIEYRGLTPAGVVVIVHVRAQQVAQMSLAKYDDMIKTFAPDRTDQNASVSCHAIHSAVG